MRCLVCHKKVSRFRYWKTKSEFCSEEHAEQYKRQTLDRLLRDQESLIRKANAPPLPIIDDDDLETVAAAQQGFEGGIDRSHMLPAAKDESALDPGGLTEQASAPAADPWEGESTPSSVLGGPASTEDVLTQSPQQALEALQQLAQSSQSSPTRDLGEGTAENRAQPSDAEEGEAASVLTGKSEASSMMDRLMEATESSEPKGPQDFWLEEKEFAEHLAGTGDTLPGEVLVTPPPAEEPPIPSWLSQDEDEAEQPAADTESSPAQGAQTEQERLAESTQTVAQSAEELEDRHKIGEQADPVDAKNKTASKPIPARLLSEELKSLDFEPDAAGMDLEESADSAEDSLAEAPPVEQGGDLRALESQLSEPAPADVEEDELSELLAEPAEEEPAASAPAEQPEEKAEKVVPFPAPGEREEVAPSVASAVEAWLDLEPLEPVAKEAVAEGTAEPGLPSSLEESAILQPQPELHLGSSAIATRAIFGMTSGDAPKVETTLDLPVPQEIEWSPAIEENTTDLISGGIAAELYSEGARLPDERALRATASPASLLMLVDPAPFESISDKGIKQQADVDMPGLEIRSAGEAPSSGPLKAAVWKRALDPCSGLLPVAPALQLAPQHPVAEIHGDVARSKVECRLPVASGAGYGLSVQCRLVPEVRLHRSSWPALVESDNPQVVNEPEIPDGASQSIPPQLALQLPEGAYHAIVGGRATFPKVDQLLLAFALADQRRVWQSSASLPVGDVGPGRPDEWVEELQQAPADWRAEPIGPLLAVQGPANLDPCEYA